MNSLVNKTTPKHIMLPYSIICSPLLSEAAKTAFMQLVALSAGLENSKTPSLEELEKTEAFKELVAFGVVVITPDSITLTDELIIKQNNNQNKK